MNIAICASMSFYREVISFAKQLQKIGHTPIVPTAAMVMEKDQDFDTTHYLSKYYGNNVSEDRLRAITTHFEEIAKADAILVVNLPKNNFNGYIGGNVLMEMGLALYLRKHTFVLNPIDRNLPLRDECLALNPTILHGDITRIEQEGSRG